MAEKRLDIIVKARSMVKAGFQQAAQQAKSFQQKMGQPFGMSGVAAAAAKGFAAVSILQGGVDALRGVTRALKGDWAGVEQIIETLPLGVGAFAKSLRDLAREWLGVNDQIRETQKLLKENQVLHAKNLRAIADEKRADAGLARIREGVSEQRQRRVGGPTAGLKIELGRRSAEVKALYAAKGKHFGLGAADKRERDQLLGELTREYDQQVAKLREESGRKAREKISDMRKKEADDARQAARRLADLNSELHQKRLRAAGKNQEAEIEQIKQYYLNAIEATKSGAEKEALAKLQAQDIAAVGRRAGAATGTAAYGGVGAIEVSTRFLGIAERFKAEANLDRKRNSVLVEQLATTKQSQQTLEMIEANLASGEGGIVVKVA